MGIELSAEQAAPGQALTLAGADAFTPCPLNDQGEPDGTGWTASPLKDLPVDWVQDGRSTTLAVVDANEQGENSPLPLKSRQARLRGLPPSWSGRSGPGRSRWSSCWSSRNLNGCRPPLVRTGSD
jgi:hypothetical protein